MFMQVNVPVLNGFSHAKRIGKAWEINFSLDI